MGAIWKQEWLTLRKNQMEVKDKDEDKEAEKEEEEKGQSWNLSDDL